MELNRKIFKTELDGEEISIEVSELAGQTNASVIGKHGNTVVLATVVMGSEDRPGDFFPLTVDYEERFYAAGKIIGSRFVRREGRPSDEATLSARLIDRAIRPLFDHRLRRETHYRAFVRFRRASHFRHPVERTCCRSKVNQKRRGWRFDFQGIFRRTGKMCKYDRTGGR